jgi:hypothetical protein
MLRLLLELDLAGAGNAMVTVRRITPHQDITGPSHAGAISNQLAGIFVTGASDFDFQVSDLPIGGDVA